MFKYIFFCFILLFPSSSPCRKDHFAVSYFSTQHMWELLAGNRTAVLPRHARGRRIRSYPDLCASKFNKTNLKQGAHIHQPTASPVPHACAQLASSFACCSRLPSRDSPKGRACSQATSIQATRTTAIFPGETRALVIQWNF